MPLTTQIRNNLSVVLAIAAAVFAGYAYISHLHYKALSARMETVAAQNERMLSTNEQQASIINELTKQREIDDRILRLLAEQQMAIKSQGDQVRSKLEELADNDTAIRSLFNLRLPPATIRLLHDQVRGGTPAGSVETTPIPTDRVPGP